MAIIVHVTNVAGGKPTIAHHCQRSVRTSVVAAHYVLPANQNFAIAGNNHFDPFERFAD